MKPATRDRLVLPVLLPLVLLVVIAGALFGFSRLLLDVSAMAATTTALIVAAGIVGVAAYAVSRPQVRGSTVAAMAGGVAGIAMLTGGVALAVLAGEGEGGGHGGEPPPAAGGLTVVAQNIAFDTDLIELPADVPTTITFDNQDGGVQHNIAVFVDDSLADVLFQGEIITGPAEIAYELEPIEAGEYYFHCDVHPNMNGAVVVADEGGGGGGGATGATGVTGGATGDATGATGDGGGGGAQPSTVVAKNIAFDTQSISLPAGEQSTITFDNQDPGTAHNIAIYEDESLAAPLFPGEIVTGPTTIDYTIPPLEAGEYYFHCDVHPNMNGGVTVS